MNDIVELERRITAALERIGNGLDAALSASGAGAVSRHDGAAEPSSDGAELARLTEALDSERQANRQLTERVRAIREKQETTITQLDRRVEKMTRQLDVQGLELQRMRKTNIQLRESLRSLQEAMSSGVADPHLINRAMQVELEALRVSRMAEMSELDEILDEIDPIVARLESAAAEGAENGGAADA